MNATTVGAVLIALGVVLFGLLARLVLDRGRQWGWRAFFLIVLLPPAAGASLAGLMRFSAGQGSPPAPDQRTLYRGVSYERVVTEADTPRVTHVVRIDLEAKGLSFLVSPGDASKLVPLVAKTASEFVTEHKLEVGLVGGSFTPGYQTSPWAPPLPPGSYVKPQGRTTSRSVDIGKGDAPATLYITDKNEVSIGKAPSSVHNALTGDCVLIGTGADLGSCPVASERIARSAAGLDATGKVLSLVVVDGHRPAASAGVTAEELRVVCEQLGLTQAVHMGAGPQAELVVRTEADEVEPLSVPMGEGLAGSERRVGAVLGVQAHSRLD